MAEQALVGIIMGSKSDLPVMEACTAQLEEFGVPYELVIASAHRSPAKVHEWASTAADRGIKVIVAEMLERRIKDPRIGFVTVTDVRVTGDTQQATIFYTVFGEQDQLDETAKALESAKGLIRSEVGKQLGMRTVPTLEFVHDALPETARNLDDLLAKARAQDAAVAAQREGASYANDEDPYKKPREVDADDANADDEDA